jgi:hypothetical protein
VEERASIKSRVHFAALADAFTQREAA